MNETPSRNWKHKFADSFRGLGLALNDINFVPHLVMAALVVAFAVFFRVSLIEWCVLLLCITIVLAAEAFNSSIEWLVKALHPEHDPKLRNALDIASGAVLICAIGAAIVGVIIFVYRLLAWLSWL